MEQCPICSLASHHIQGLITNSRDNVLTRDSRQYHISCLLLIAYKYPVRVHIRATKVLGKTCDICKMPHQIGDIIVKCGRLAHPTSYHQDCLLDHYLTSVGQGRYMLG